MAAELFNRYVWLAETIYSANKISKSDIDKCWSKSVLNYAKEDTYEIRSFHRHKEAIHELFGLQIECDKRNGNLYYISNIKKLSEGSFREWLLAHLAINGMLCDTEELKGRVIFDPAGKGIENIPTITRAMRQRHPIIMTLEDETFQFFPYALREHCGEWYVVGCRNNEEQKYEIIPVTTIVKLDILESSHWKYPSRFKVKELFEGYLGISREEKPQTIRIRVSGTLVDKLRKTPFHSSQVEHTKNGVTEMEYTLAPNRDLINAIQNLGAAAEVIYPESLRQVIKDDLQAKATIYGMKFRYAGEQLSLFD